MNIKSSNMGTEKEEDTSLVDSHQILINLSEMEGKLVVCVFL